MNMQKPKAVLLAIAPDFLVLMSVSTVLVYFVSLVGAMLNISPAYYQLQIDVAAVPGLAILSLAFVCGVCGLYWKLERLKK